MTRRGFLGVLLVATAAALLDPLLRTRPGGALRMLTFCVFVFIVAAWVLAIACSVVQSADAQIREKR